MAQFIVSPQTLQSKAQELSSLNARFKAAIETLQSQESSLNGQWDGDAHDAFHTAFTTDVQKLTTFYNAVTEYVQKLDAIAVEYSKAEQTNLSKASARTV